MTHIFTSLGSKFAQIPLNTWTNTIAPQTAKFIRTKDADGLMGFLKSHRVDESYQLQVLQRVVTGLGLTNWGEKDPQWAIDGQQASDMITAVKVRVKAEIVSRYQRDGLPGLFPSLFQDPKSTVKEKKRADKTLPSMKGMLIELQRLSRSGSKLERAIDEIRGSRYIIPLLEQEYRGDVMLELVDVLRRSNNIEVDKAVLKALKASDSLNRDQLRILALRIVKLALHAVKEVGRRKSLTPLMLPLGKYHDAMRALKIVMSQPAFKDQDVIAGKIGTLVSRIGNLTRHKDWQVRDAATSALSELILLQKEGSRHKSSRRLHELLSDERRQVRNSAKSALKEIQDHL